MFGSVRRNMAHTVAGVTRVFGTCAYVPRKRVTIFFGLLFAAMVSIVIINISSTHLPQEDEMEQRLAEMQMHLQFLDSLYQARMEDVIALQAKVLTGRGNQSQHHLSDKLYGPPQVTMSPEITALLKNLTGTRAAAGLQSKNLQLLRLPFVYQLLPHLMEDPYSLRPIFHMKGGKNFANVVMGVPTVKRDKESYLMITLTHLINGLPEADLNSTLIVVLIGETDLEYILNTARQIETLFPKHVDNGIIEVLAPSPSYYPDLEALQSTLGDSKKRFKWRTKQNLDAIYLMAYAQTKGTFYLMLEDDVIAKKSYMEDMKQFISMVTISNPKWFFIEFCHIGGIGKLFRSSDLVHFITYVQLFYNNMPIDWLLESYLADKVCTIDKTSKSCGVAKLEIRPKYKTSLFQHIGLYSSLKGKIQKVKDSQFGAITTFYPHNNPPLERLKTDIEERMDHSLKKAYVGRTFFWGLKPKKGNVVEFWFEKPTAIQKYTFRSSNVEHVSDKFYDTVVEVLPASVGSNFTVVGSFDEFGLAEGELPKEMGPFTAIRLKVNKDSHYWVILSEIDLKTFDAER